MHSSRQEALLYVFEDNEAVIKMIIKGRSPAMRHVSKTHRVALDWLFGSINLDPKIQIKYIDTKNQLADILTKGNFTRDEWNQLLCLFNISHFSSTNCLEAMSKRTQEDAGEERVTAKSKPMMNFVSRSRVRDPTVLASTASERPVLGASSSNYSEWNIDNKWSSQVWKSGEMSSTSTGLPVYDKFVIDDDMDLDTVTESNFSVRSRSFLNRVNDRLRKMLDRSPEDAMQDIDKRFTTCGTFMSSTFVFMGKNYSENLHSIKNTGNNLTLKQMFEISEKLIVGQSDEIFGVTPINWEDSSWKKLSLVSDEEVIRSSHAKVYVFISDSVLCLGEVSENPQSNYAWEDRLTWFKSSPQYRTLDTIDGEPMEFEWNIFPGFTTLQLSQEVQEFMTKMGDPSQCKGRIIFMSMFNDIIWGSENNERECNANATLVSIFAKRFPAGRSSFLGPGSETKWYSTDNERLGGEWDRVDELMMIKFEESGHPFFRATSPLSRGTLQSKGGGKLSIHFCADGDTIVTVFRTFISVNQIRIYGAVSDLCDEYRACQARTGRPVLAGQSDPLFEPARLLMTTSTPLTELPAQENLLQEYKERVERLSQQNRVIKICTDAGFLTTVQAGQYFMTKDTEEFSQFTEPVTCREYTLPRDEKSSDPKGWIRGNTKIGPVLEVTTCCLQGKKRVEIRIESMNKDNSHSWVRISHGLNKLVTDLSNNKENDNNEQETSETKSEEFALKTNVLAFCKPIKGSSKTTKIYLCLLIYKNCTYL